MSADNSGFCVPVEITEEDIYEAMRNISGYLDITPDDFKHVYVAAFDHAVRRLSEDIEVEQVMSVDVVTVTPETPLEEVAAVMAARRVSGVPVVDSDGGVIGVVSEHDFLALMSGSDGTFMEVVAACVSGQQCLVGALRGKVAREIMTAPPLVAAVGEPLMVAVERMRQRGVNRLPVLDGEERLVGILTRGDALMSARRADR